MSHRRGRRSSAASAAGSASLAAVALAAAGGALPAASASSPVPGHVYMDGPPPGHTSGFGEPTCARCHFDATMNPPAARLELRGLPERFVPDSAYRLTVRVTGPDLGAAGFEAAVRCAEGGRKGRQAGRLSAPDGRAEVVRGGGEELAGDTTVLYARHTGEGSRATAPDTATWRLEWVPPADPPATACPAVTFHVAANAANGDASEFGDRVLTGSWPVTAGEP